MKASKGEKKPYFHAFLLSTSQPMPLSATPIITPTTLQKVVTGDCPIEVSSFSSLSPGGGREGQCTRSK